MSRLGIGIIGAGSIARAHAAAYAQFANECQMVAVADVFAERAKEFAQQLGSEVQAYDNALRLLEREDVHLVSICTPPFTHTELTLAALQAGKHVWVEKPIAPSLAECDNMISAAEQAGRVLAGVFQNRYRPEYQRAKALMRSGELGRLVLAKADCLWWRGRNYYEVWWRGTWEKECGGVTINHAVHHIDLLLWLVGETVVSVFAEMDTFTHDVEVEDLSCAVLRFANGAIGSIVSTVSAHQNTDRIEITCEHADLLLPGMHIWAQCSSPNGFPVPDEERAARLCSLADSVAIPAGEGHAPQLRDVLDAIASGREPEVSAREARRSLEVITAIYKSASTGEVVRLPLSPDDPFYTTEGIWAGVRRAQRRQDVP